MQYLVEELNEHVLYQSIDGESGLELAIKHRPDLIICDIMLPRMDGLAICRKLHKHRKDYPANVLVLTARVDERTRLEALKAGARDFLTKPFSAIELKTRVNNLLERSELERALHEKNIELNHSLDELKIAQDQAIQNARLSAVGNLSAGIMHEIKNPLNCIATAMACLKPQISTQLDTLEIVEDIDEELTRIDQTIRELASFAYGKIQQREPISFETLWQKASTLLRINEEENLQIENQLSKSTIVANEKQMLLLLTNLTQNAINATKPNLEQGKQRLITIRSKLKDNQYILCVEDNGRGLSPKELESFFDPYYTPSESESSMGLGLSICHTIVTQHRGDVSVARDSNKHTIVSVKLPLK